MAISSTKSRTQFSCTACGEPTQRWEGKCPTCGEWNSLVENVVRPAQLRAGRATPAAALTNLGGIGAETTERVATGMPEIDRVLGGGIVPGALILLGGDPGIGKSTLALQLADRVGTAASPALYCAGEESAAQLAMRARRLGCASERVEVVAETDLDVLLATIEAHVPSLAIIDSVQTVFDAGIAGVPGSPSQVRAAVARLMACAKSVGVSIMLIGHVTKEGAIAGPRTLEHMVDVVLYLEGERHGDHRLLRGIKNRFGSTGELGLFEMIESGLRELDAPGRAFLDETSLGVAGNVLTVMCEGSRALAVEVQALEAKTSFGLPRRTASGFDIGRLHLLIAVLEKRARINLGQSDVYVNAVGGVRLVEPAVDLAVALAVAGSAREMSLPAGTVVLGEIGLGGEVRRVRRMDARLSEASQLGIIRAVIPAAYDGRVPAGMQTDRVATVADAVKLLNKLHVVR